MKKDTRDKKILEYISTLPEAVQMDKGVIMYHMADRGWDGVTAWLLLDKVRLWHSIESACMAIGKGNDARSLRYKAWNSEALREILELAKNSIYTKALENVINLQTQAENENVRLSSSKLILENLHPDFKQSKEVSKSINIHAFIDATKSKQSGEIWGDMIRFLRNSGE